jgi:chromosome segregation ATPase
MINTTSNIHSRSHNDFAYALAGVTTVTAICTGVWGIYKNMELNYLKSERDIHNHINQLIKQSYSYIDQIHSQYMTLSDANNALSLYTYNETKDFFNSFSHHIQQLNTYMYALRTHIKTHQHKHINVIQQAESTAHHINQTITSLKQTLRHIETHKYSILSAKIIHEYPFKELTHLARYNSRYYDELKYFILKHYNTPQYKFTHIAFVNNAQSFVSSLKNYLYKASCESHQIYKNECIEAQTLIPHVEKAIATITQSQEYAYEKQQKTLYEKEQKMLKMQEADQKHRHEQEKRQKELQLVKEKNRAEKLRQEKMALQIERDKVNIEYEKMKSGRYIDDKVKERTHHLESKISSYTHNIHRLESDIQTSTIQIDNIKKDLNKLVKDIKNNNSNSSIQQCIRTLKEYVSRYKNNETIIEKIKKIIHNPPYNPHTHEGLKGCMDDIKHLVK